MSNIVFISKDYDLKEHNGIPKTFSDLHTIALALFNELSINDKTFCCYDHIDKRFMEIDSEQKYGEFFDKAPVLANSQYKIYLFATSDINVAYELYNKFSDIISPDSQQKLSFPNQNSKIDQNSEIPYSEEPSLHQMNSNRAFNINELQMSKSEYIEYPYEGNESQSYSDTQNNGQLHREENKRNENENQKNMEARQLVKMDNLDDSVVQHIGINDSIDQAENLYEQNMRAANSNQLPQRYSTKIMRMEDEIERDRRSDGESSQYMQINTHQDRHQDMSRSSQSLKCGNCGSLLAGTRYRCLICENQYLCEGCEDSSEHSKVHAFTKIYNANQENVVSQMMVGASFIRQSELEQSRYDINISKSSIKFNEDSKHEEDNKEESQIKEIPEYKKKQNSQTIQSFYSKYINREILTPDPDKLEATVRPNHQIQYLKIQNNQVKAVIEFYNTGNANWERKVDEKNQVIQGVELVTESINLEKQRKIAKVNVNKGSYYIFKVKIQVPNERPDMEIKFQLFQIRNGSLNRPFGPTVTINACTQLVNVIELPKIQLRQSQVFEEHKEEQYTPNQVEPPKEEVKQPEPVIVKSNPIQYETPNEDEIYRQKLMNEEDENLRDLLQQLFDEGFKDFDRNLDLILENGGDLDAVKMELLN